MSIQVAEADERAEAERTKREQAQEERAKELTVRNLRLFQRLVAVLVMAIVLSGGFGIFALDKQDEAETQAAIAQQERDNALEQQRIAEQNEQEAERSALENQSLALAAGSQAALARGDSETAIALAVAANNISDNAPLFADKALYDVATSPGLYRYFETTYARSNHAISSDNQRIAIASYIGTEIDLSLWDIATNERLWTAPEDIFHFLDIETDTPPALNIRGLSFSSDNRSLMISYAITSAVFDQGSAPLAAECLIVDAETFEVIQRLSSPDRIPRYCGRVANMCSDGRSLSSWI